MQLCVTCHFRKPFNDIGTPAVARPLQGDSRMAVISVHPCSSVVNGLPTLVARTLSVLVLMRSVRSVVQDESPTTECTKHTESEKRAEALWPRMNPHDGPPCHGTTLSKDCRPSSSVADSVASPCPPVHVAPSKRKRRDSLASSPCCKLCRVFPTGMRPWKGHVRRVTCGPF